MAGKENERPTPTVTLWRYVSNGVVDTDSDGRIDIDEAYAQGVVSQVTYLKSGDEKDTILSYNLDQSQNESNIEFTYETSSGVKKFILPGNDDHGQEYTYFVRETLSGTNADNYSITYLDKDGVHKYGAGNKGTITNVRREKAAVTVKKIWKNPDGLSEIDGSKVQMKIFAPLKSDTSTNPKYKELQVYSSQAESYEILDGQTLVDAQTIEGFTKTTPFSEVTYYVNVYDEEGNPYDMGRARFVESVTLKNQASPKNPSGLLADTFVVGSYTYKLKTKAEDEEQLGDGTSLYKYTQMNIAQIMRTYDLEKYWHESISEDAYSDVTKVEFRLERCTLREFMTNSNPQYETVKNADGTDYFTIDRVDGSRNWNGSVSVEKYDDDGNEYYYRAFESGFYIKGNNGVEQPYTIGIINTERTWSVLYHRDTQKTQAVNYIPVSGGGFFTITKTWLDNNEKQDRADVKVRVYKRADVLTKLNTDLTAAENKKDKSDFVDLDSLSYVQEITLTKDNNYTAEFSYKGDNLRDSDYMVIECTVGSTEQEPTYGSYTYEQLLQAASEDGNIYGYKGAIQNKDYQFDVSVSSDQYGDVMLINTRKGITHIGASKLWSDNRNETGIRTKVLKFKLFQNELVYTSIPDDVTVTANAITSNEGNTTENPVNIQLNHENGEITITYSSDDNSNDTSDSWAFEINNLPMYSSYGELLYYNIEEEPTTVEGVNTVSYIQRKVSTSADGDYKHQNFTFNFQNTITGTVNHVAYKYWRDASVPKDNRPDLYFSLYRYIKSDANSTREAYTEYKAQIWTNESMDNDDVQNYDMKVTIQDLPRFDEQGREYAYEFRETMNNNGKTVLGTYKMSSQIGLASKVEGDTYDVFTNTITDYMTLEGSKVWTGFQGFNIGKEVYPEPKLIIYRTVASDITDLQSMSKAEISERTDSKLGDDKRIEQVGETDLNGEKTGYDFPDNNSEELADKIVNVNGKLMLPKFNEKGVRYKYLVKESFSDETVDFLYTKSNANGTLTNTFRDDINRCKISVGKEWNRDGVEDDENKYPSVTYYLKRDGILIKTQTISAEEFQKNNGKAKCVFENLLIFSPNGKAYEYTVEEKSINGYEITYKDVSGAASSDEIKVTPQSIIGEDWKTNNANNIDVSTLNTYSDAKSIILTGAKIWNDRGNVEGLRPTTKQMELVLERSTANETGQKNKIDTYNMGVIPVKESVDESLKTPYVVWKEDASDPNKWQYTIYNLEKFAPNGMPYTYTLSEKKVTGYKKADAIKASASSIQAGDTGHPVTMSALTNQFEGEFEVQKVWYDGRNRYGLRPDNIHVKLYRSKDQGQTWEEDPYYVEMQLKNKVNSIPNTGDNSWHYIFTNLPTVDKYGNKYKYKAEETKIGGVALQKEDGKLPYAGAYEMEYTQVNDQTGLIENNLKSTSLTVTKFWMEDDNNNMYYTRPDYLEFELQKKDSKTGTWQRVKVDNQDTFKITKDENWKKTLINLPVAEIIPNEDGTNHKAYNLEYRAIEVTDGTISETIDDTSVESSLAKHAKNYQVDTEKADDHHYDETGNKNESQIRNKLILAEKSEIKVTKVWYKSGDDEQKATFELLYRTKEEGSAAGKEKIWHCYDQTYAKNHTDEVNSDNIAAHAENHASATGSITKTVSSKDAVSGTSEISWNNLPKYNREGKELEYLVVEHPIKGYQTVSTVNADGDYEFKNIELQDYTISKTWQNADYAHKHISDDAKLNGKFTAKFELQYKYDGIEWTKVPDITDNDQILISTNANDENQSYTWKSLPKYTQDGKEITYRAVETEINGKPVVVNSKGEQTSGDYKVTYTYDGHASEQFQNTKTVATNRMIYGFVNLKKSAAYLASAVVSSEKSLKGAEFNILKYKEKDGSITDETEEYATGIFTDESGNLIDSDGKYNGRYLITGKYKIVEVRTTDSSLEKYSVWKNGVDFYIGENITQSAHEHQTAWIQSQSNGKLVAEYQNNPGTHHFEDNCKPTTNEASAYDFESRGVITFTKTGKDGEKLDTHSGAAGESQAYFGVYAKIDGEDILVAGMKPLDEDAHKDTFVLTNKDQNGNEIQVNYADNLPYLRPYDGGFSILSGTYTIKELVAPAGYKIDDTERTAEVALLEYVDHNDAELSKLYAKNIAKIDDIENGKYKWENEKNILKIYKKDQYGRNVDLHGKYLELRIGTDSDTSKFPTNTKVINLYQDNSKFSDDIKKYVTYDNAEKCWIISGLFDIDKTFTLSEPDSSIPQESVQAEPITYQIDEYGKLTIVNGTSLTGEKQTNGEAYKSYYEIETYNVQNQITMRDVSRYRADVEIQKRIKDTDTAIPYISFKLYKYDLDDENRVTNERSVLPDDVVLTTDSAGKIRISNAKGTKITTDKNGNITKLEEVTDIENKITGCDIKYGLDYGNYYLKEIELGASDKYVLHDKNIYFKVVAKSGSEHERYSDYAEVVFDASDTEVTQVDEHTGKVANEPQKDKKILNLTKVNKEADPEKLANTKFTLEYTSITNGQEGSSNTKTFYCHTDENGVIRLDDTNEAVDISEKGTYVLKETKATDTYITPTDENGGIPVILKIRIGSDNKIEVLERYERLTNEPTFTDGLETNLDITLKNEDTSVTVSKRNDIETNDGKDIKTKNQKSTHGEQLNGAVLEIFEGTDSIEGQTALKTLDTDSLNTDSINEWTLTRELKENTIYRLHEKSAPVGFMKADDIFFKIYGNAVENGSTICASQIFVWTPDEEHKNETPTVNGNYWSKSENINNNRLVMVDEAIIAPVDAKKVMKKVAGGYEKVSGVTFDVYRGEDKIGQAISGSDGYLSWVPSANNSYGYGYIYSMDGERIKEGANLSGKIVLRQSETEKPYKFVEADTPDTLYNENAVKTDDEKIVYLVNINEENYIQYRKDKNYYVDMKEATASEATHYCVTSKTRNHKATEHDIVNEEFTSYIELTKRDADEEGGNAGIAGAIFELRKDGSVYTKAYDKDKNLSENGRFQSDENGLLHIEVREKGTYTLTEVEAPKGYTIDNTFTIPEFTFTDEDYGKQKYITREDSSNVSDVPNNRKMGTLTHKKTDNKGNTLNGVEYTLTRTSGVDGHSGYLLSESKVFVTGKSYAAKKTGSGWTFEEKDISNERPGVLEITGLNWGEYKLKETRELSGYKYEESKEYHFAIDGTEKKYTIDGEETLGTLAYNSNHDNTKNEIKILKTNTQGTTRLKGGEFEVYSDSEHTEAFKIWFTVTTEKIDQKNKTIYTVAKSTDANATSTVLTDDEGEIILRGLETNNHAELDASYKSYYLAETKAPDGYRLDKNVKHTEFQVDRYGRLKVDNVLKSEVHITNEPIKISIDKRGETDELLTDAEFTLTDACNMEYDATQEKFVANSSIAAHKLADGSAERKQIKITRDENGRFIPDILFIGGHTYTLKETKAPEGYEATAVVTFTVDKYGEITNISSTGGYTTETSRQCAEKNPDSDSRYTNVTIRDEKIRMEIQKVEYETGDSLGDGTDETKFVLKPYTDKDRFNNGKTEINLTTVNGKTQIDPTDLIHGHKYLLKETKTVTKHYIGQELKKGVILSVQPDGSIVIERQNGIKGDCPVSVIDGSQSNLKVKNRKATSFEVTKYVDGNMGDLNGTFKIKMRVVEPEGNEVGTDTTELHLNGKYDSDTNASDASTFKNGLPLNGTLYISEDNDLDYEAVVLVNDTEIKADKNGEVAVPLNSDSKVVIKLTNRKNVKIDMGVSSSLTPILAMLALLILACWLFVRYRREQTLSD